MSSPEQLKQQHMQLVDSYKAASKQEFDARVSLYRWWRKNCPPGTVVESGVTPYMPSPACRGYLVGHGAFDTGAVIVRWTDSIFKGGLETNTVQSLQGLVPRFDLPPVVIPEQSPTVDSLIRQHGIYVRFDTTAGKYYANTSSSGSVSVDAEADTVSEAVRGCAAKISGLSSPTG